MRAQLYFLFLIILCMLASTTELLAQTFPEKPCTASLRWIEEGPSIKEIQKELKGKYQFEKKEESRIVFKKDGDKLGPYINISYKEKNIITIIFSVDEEGKGKVQDELINDLKFNFFPLSNGKDEDHAMEMYSMGDLFSGLMVHILYNEKRDDYAVVVGVPINMNVDD